MTAHLYWTPKPIDRERLPDILRDVYEGSHSYRVTNLDFLNGVWAALKGEEKAAVEKLIRCLEDGNEVDLEIR